MARCQRFPIAFAAALIVVATSAARAHAAPGIARAALDVAALRDLRGVGLLVVGDDDRISGPALGLARASIAAAGHRVVPLPTWPEEPARRWLVESCAAHDLDAVALVRISPDPGAWRVNVDIRDPEGRQLLTGSRRGPEQDHLLGEGNSTVPMFAVFSFKIAPDDVVAYERQLATARPPQAARAETEEDRLPRLWVSEHVTMLGPARLADAEFYRLVGRSDLYKPHHGAIAVTRTIGYTALGAGVTTLVLAAAGAGLVKGACAGPNFVDMASGQPASCDDDVSAVFVIPLGLAALGGGFLIASHMIGADQPSLETRRTLARDYNARLALSAAPSARLDGGVMMINGRF